MMEAYTGENQKKPGPSPQEPCNCLTCKIGRTIQAHFPGDPNVPIPPNEMAEMRNALATVSGALMLGASLEEATKFARDMQEAQRRARVSTLVDALFGAFTRR